ncbi:MAG: hypothetical protein V3U08_04035 [Nitrospirales bacterium]
MLKKAIGKSFIAFAAVMSAIVFSIIFGPVKAEVSTKTVALTGNPAPGTPAGVNFRGLETPLLNDRGEVAFPLTPGPNAEELTNGRTLPGTEG